MLAGCKVRSPRYPEAPIFRPLFNQHWLTGVWIALGVLWGEGALWCVSRQALYAEPPGWEAVISPIPIPSVARRGQAPKPGDGWRLGGHARWQANTSANEVLARVVVPPGGLVELRIAQDPGHIALVLSRAGTPQTWFGQRGTNEGQEAWSLASPEQALCKAPLWTNDPSAPIDLGLRIQPGGVQLKVGEEITTCDVASQGGRPVLRAGLRELNVLALSTSGLDTAFAPTPFLIHHLLLGLLGGLLGALGAFGLRRIGFSVKTQLIAGILASFPLMMVGADLPALLENLRILADYPFTWPLGASLIGLATPLALTAAATPLVGVPHRAWSPLAGLSWGLAGLGLGGEAVVILSLIGLLFGIGLGILLPRVGENGPSGALGITLFGLFGTCVAAAMGPWAWTAILAGGLIAALLGWMAWVLANLRVGGSLLVLFGCVLLFGLAEWGLSWTFAGERLIGRRQTAGDARHTGKALGKGEAATGLAGAVRSFASLDADLAASNWGIPRDGWPLRPRPRAQPLRVVAFGSSSTGGAFQIEDPSTFWPARLEARLGPAVEVLNQGAGGWTSFHVKTWLERHGTVLDPDIAIVYLGHNDLLTPSRAPYSRIYASQGQSTARFAQVLDEFRLFALFRALVELAAGLDQGVAVPLREVHENLREITRMVAEEGGRTLLVTEAVQPDPGILTDYDQIARTLARTPGVGHLEAGPPLVRGEIDDHFLDDCHLTPLGHQRLSELIHQHLQQQAWLATSEPAPPALTQPSE